MRATGHIRKTMHDDRKVAQNAGVAGGDGFHTRNKCRESKLQRAQTLWVFDEIITEIIVPTIRLGASASASGNTAPKAPAAN